MTQTPFEDRVEAGRCLANELKHIAIPPDTIVIALARGGGPVGYEVADRLQLAFDVIAARRIEVPWQSEITIGAVVGTESVLDDGLVKTMGISSCELSDIVPDEIECAARESAIYHRHAPALDTCGRSVVVVDDGLDTGDTMLAAVRYIRRARPSLIVAAAPVGPVGAFARLRSEADLVISVERPQFSCSIGEHFREFDDVTVDEIQKLLCASRRQQLRTLTMKSTDVTAPLASAAAQPNTTR